MNRPTSGKLTLPSAKPPQSLVLVLLGLSTAVGVAGIGLSGIAVSIYLERAGDRLSTAERITAVEQQAEVNQRKAQLKRGYDAPVWVTNQVYAPGVAYQIGGVRETAVPVIIGPQLDTAVCVGTMGPDGFIQNTEDPLCLGY